jgi:hypothetical protein
MSTDILKSTQIDQRTFSYTNDNVEDNSKKLVIENAYVELSGLVKDSAISDRASWAYQKRGEAYLIKLSVMQIVIGLFTLFSISSGLLFLNSVFSTDPILSFKFSGFIFIGAFGLTLELIYSKRLKNG